MFISSLLIFALSTATLAHPTTLSKKDVTSCTTPKSFTISRFTKFTPASSNPKPARVNFRYNDDGASVSTDCELMGSTSTTAPDAPIACENPSVKFLFEGSILSIWEDYAGCNTTEKAQVKGSIFVGTYCYPSPAGVPLGEGTSCQTPSVSLGGSLASA